MYMPPHFKNRTKLGAIHARCGSRVWRRWSRRRRRADRNAAATDPRRSEGQYGTLYGTSRGPIPVKAPVSARRWLFSPGPTPM